MEASTLTPVARRGLLARRSPVLKLEKDERLVAMIRAGHEGAFETLFNRYHARLLAFCSSMLKSRQDAEDVLQEVFANAHKAMLADDRKINVRPWLYRIARNRCLNHLRKPVPEGQDSMDIHPHLGGTTTDERVQKREELRQVLADVGHLPETQRTALLLREIDQLSYEDIAVAMETTIPAVKSLLVRARISLAESSEARTLSCDEVRLTLAEAAEGISKATGPVRQHVRHCEGCAGFRDQLRADRKALAAIIPIGPLAALKFGLLGKLFGGGAAGGAASGGTAGTGAAAGALGSSAAAAGSSATAGGLGAIGGAIGTKAAAGVATAALLTAGAVEVKHVTDKQPTTPAAIERAVSPLPPPEKPKGDRPNRKVAAGAAAAGAGSGAEQAVADDPDEKQTDGGQGQQPEAAGAETELAEDGTQTGADEFENEGADTPIDRPPVEGAETDLGIGGRKPGADGTQETPPADPAGEPTAPTTQPPPPPPVTPEDPESGSDAQDGGSTSPLLPGPGPLAE